MDVKKALKVLKQIDSLESIEDLLLEHNGLYILSWNRLSELNVHLAEQYEEIELAAPYLFFDNGRLSTFTQQMCVNEGIIITKATADDFPLRHFFHLDNFSVGISDH
jgi:hypothetical protein